MGGIKCIASAYPMVLLWGERANSNSKKSPYIKIPCSFFSHGSFNV